MSPEKLPKATILLADDDAALRELLCEQLESSGYRVLTAHDGEAGLRVAAEHEGSIELLLSDVVMPNANGLELATRLRAERPGLRVVLMSGSVFEAGRKLDSAPPGTRFLPKPFSEETLLGLVRELLSA